MILKAHVSAVAKMRKAELIDWLEADGQFSVLRGWADYTVDELRSEVLQSMGRHNDEATNARRSGV